MRRFHYKIMAICALLGTITFLASLLFTYSYFYNAYETKTKGEFQSTAKEIRIQIENRIAQMDETAVEFISHQDYIQTLKSLSYGKLDEEQANENYLFLRNNIMRGRSNAGHRFCVFSDKGYLFTDNEDRVLSGPVIMQRIGMLDWLDEVRAAEGRRVVIPTHADTWSQDMQQQVFSVARLIRDPGKEIGFAEVQESTDYLDRICPRDLYNTVLFDKNGNIIFQNTDWPESRLEPYINNEQEGFGEKDAFYFYQGIPSIGWTVLLIQSKESFLGSFRITRNAILAVSAMFIAVMLLLSYYLSVRTTKPLRQLKKAMESMDMKTLQAPGITIKGKGDEIASLNRSFNVMRDQLSESMRTEISLRSMQLRQHFETLQAQINPHFIHNLLNAIMEMAYEERPDDVANVCQKISDMLRYSTDSRDIPSTIEQELCHVSNYLSLMKERYLDKLTYEIHMDDEVGPVAIPKLIIQPIVENIFYHGYAKEKASIRIWVSARKYGENGWQITVEDDGVGFSADVLESMRRKIKAYGSDLANAAAELKEGIGNMGMMNTFARLELFYEKAASFEISNREEGGACVRFFSLDLE